MFDRKNPAGASGYSSPFALAVTAIAICLGVAMGTAAALSPKAATPEVSAAATYDGPAGYLPAQLVNQAKDIEPMPVEYY